MKLHKVRGGNNRVSLLERAMQKKKKEKRRKEKKKAGIHYSRLIAHESIGGDRGPVKRNNHARSFGGSQALCSEGLTLTDLTFRSLRTSVSSAKTKTSLPTLTLFTGSYVRGVGSRVITCGIYIYKKRKKNSILFEGDVSIPFCLFFFFFSNDRV